MKPMKISGFYKMLLIAVLSLANLRPSIADPMLLLTGADVSSHSSYDYVGGILQLGHSGGESGVIAKAWFDHLRYDYKAADTKVYTSSNGVQAAIGYQWLRADGFATASLGIESRDTSSSPLILPAQNGYNRHLISAVSSISLAQDISKDAVFDGIASYTDKSRDYWSRARILAKTTGSLRWGPELVLQGNPDYSAYRLGVALAGIPVGEKTRLEGNAGYAKTRGVGGGIYMGISLALPF